jgi:hypothetical protein
MAKSKPTAKPPASVQKPAPKSSAKTPARSAAKSARARAKAQPRTPRFSDSEIDLTPVRIVDDRRFSGKFQIVEDEGERRVLGWGFPSVQAARRWIENRNHLSAWLRFILRSE